MISLTARRTFAGVLLITLLAVSSTIPAAARAKFSALAVDARTGEILFSKDPDGLRHPASLTKVMTLYILFQEMRAGRLTLNSKLKVSRYASTRPPTKLGVKAGQSIRVEDAIKALITLSANDVAVVVGENIGGSEAAFAKRMTTTAKALGMSRTTFRNASGLPNPAQITTARDMATLSLRVQRDFPQYYSYFRLTSFKYGKRVIRTHNRLLGRFAGTDGIKTGYIRASGFNLTTSAKRGDKRIIGVVMGGRSAGARNSYMMSMLSKAFPKCKAGAKLALAVAGTSPGVMDVNAQMAEAEPALKAMAKASGKKPASKASDIASTQADMAAQPTETDNEDLAEQAETLPPAQGTTFANVIAEPEEATQASGKIANPDSETQQNAVVAPVEASLAPTLPFKIKKANDTKGGQVIVPTTQSSWNIQIGAYPTKKAAQDALYVIRNLNHKLFDNTQAFTVEVKKGEETVFRARMSGFSKATARNACKTLSRKGIGCVTLSPQS